MPTKYTAQKDNEKGIDLVISEVSKEKAKSLENTLKPKLTHYCKICKTEFFRKSNDLRTHLKLAHETLTELSCKFCRLVFRYLSTFKGHMEFAHPKIKFNIETCNENNIYPLLEPDLSKKKTNTLVASKDPKSRCEYSAKN